MKSCDCCGTSPYDELTCMLTSAERKRGSFVDGASTLTKLAYGRREWRWCKSRGKVRREVCGKGLSECAMKTTLL